jgi:hypothetical protein
MLHAEWPLLGRPCSEWPPPRAQCAACRLQTGILEIFACSTLRSMLSSLDGQDAKPILARSCCRLAFRLGREMRYRMCCLMQRTGAAWILSQVVPRTRAHGATLQSGASAFVADPKPTAHSVRLEPCCRSVQPDFKSRWCTGVQWRSGAMALAGLARAVPACDRTDPAPASPGPDPTSFWSGICTCTSHGRARVCHALEHAVATLPLGLPQQHVPRPQLCRTVPATSSAARAHSLRAGCALKQLDKQLADGSKSICVVKASNQVL